MRDFLMISIGFLIGVIFAKFWFGKNQILPQNGKVGRDENEVNLMRAEEHRKNLDRILASFGANDEITNDMVEKMLGVSNTSAERYLDELEKQGKLRQIGRTGRSVTYLKK
ncbi:MAG: hypothetical protein HYV13_00665 [Candidatus Doudnabacteria bacterium]|nr:hypothetical protein [Candidatus Doudnabacteria bacterium]